MPQRIGIFGAGQLAKMLVESAYALGFVPRILAEKPLEPACQINPAASQPEKSLEGWGSFLNQIDLLLFENEFLDYGLLRHALAKHPHVQCVPRLDLMERLSDKLRQKQLLTDLKIPSAPFAAWKQGTDIAAWLSECRSLFKDSFVLKWGMLGYDGKGVRVYNSAEHHEAVAFCEAAAHKQVSLYAEKKIAFERELAIMTAHSIKGEIASYPVVISKQLNNVCYQVTGPASAWGVQRQKDAESYARTLATSLNLHGVFAIELFDTENGLLVNEIAPRVHNSGHYTQNAATTSQFENHLRAALGMPLGSTETCSLFGMQNLLGPKVAKDISQLRPEISSRSFLHWYLKDWRAGRKQGHVNFVGENRESLSQQMARIEKLWYQT